MNDIYLKDEIQLKNAKLLLVNDQITVDINNSTVEYQNTYTVFRFDADSNELIAPNFKLKVNSTDAERLQNWFIDLFI